jgi:hypothetical protein
MADRYLTAVSKDNVKAGNGNNIEKNKAADHDKERVAGCGEQGWKKESKQGQHKDGQLGFD